MTLADITEEHFRAYERIRCSGLVVMDEIDTISALAGLSAEQVEIIAKNYDALESKYAYIYE